MVHDVLLAVAVVVAILIVRAAVQTVRAVRRFRRRLLVVWSGARRGETVDLNASWWANQRDRRRMWRAIAGAERAVAAARSAGAPTGDLPSVLRQVRHAATAVDAGLALPRRSAAVLRQAAALTEAAEAVTQAAAEAVASDAAPLIARAVEAVRIELAALREPHLLTR